MRKKNGQFRERIPTDEEIEAMILLIKGGWLKMVITGIDTKFKISGDVMTGNPDVAPNPHKRDKD